MDMQQQWREESEKRKSQKIRKRKSQEKEDKVREKVGKSRNIIFCEGQKVGSLKQRVQRHIVR